MSKRSILDNHLLPSFGDLTIDKIDEECIERYKAARSHLSNKTVNNHLAVLRKILMTACEWKKIRRIPLVKRMRVNRPNFDFLSFTEATALVDAAAVEPKWHSMIIVALNAGLRLGELLALEWGDVDIKGKRLTIRRRDWRGNIDSPKSGVWRIIALNRKVVESLQQFGPKRKGLVWCKSDGTKHTKDHMASALTRIRKKAGLRHIGWHVLRHHTFASHLASLGVPLKAVQELLGHHSMEMTLRYAHLVPSAHFDAVDVLADGSVTNGTPMAHTAFFDMGSRVNATKSAVKLAS